jgi:signal transduction histidine kinase/DNA-binding response OmpR family regulator
MADERADVARELAYYKRHLDALAAERIAVEHQRWDSRIRLRQKTNGIELLSTLARSFGARTEPSSMFRVAVLAINAALEMDRTVIFVPAESPGRFVAAHVAGMSEAEVARIEDVPIDLDAQGGLVIVEASAPESKLVRSIREMLGVQTFAVVPLEGAQGPLGVLVSGRFGGAPAMIRSVDAGDADTFRAIAGMLHAITQNTRLALLEQTERLKTEFYADLAHDFRTPLTLTLGPLAQILDGKWGDLPAPIRERLEVALRNQKRLLGLINQILDLVRLEAGAAELRPERIDDVNELVTTCVGLFRPAAEARGVGVHAVLDPRLGERPMLGDRDKLERLLFNLLSNAVNFTDRGRVEVTTVLTNETLVLEVTDTGIGIAEDELPHVFERFRQAPRGNARRVASSGIGLAVVKRIAELHNGTVTAQSRRRAGSTFTVTIPFRSAAPSDSTPQDEVRPSLASAVENEPPSVDAVNRESERTFDATKPIVLYVEDDPDLRRHVHTILTTRFNVFLAVDGIDGLEKARRYAPELIVADQMMPRMDGRELLAAIRADEDLRSLPVVVLTAQFGTEGRVESLDAGADDYLTKPFHEGELLARVGNLIRSRKGERQLAELNRRLELKVREQVGELVRAGELERFVPSAVLAELGRAPQEREPKRREVTILATDLGVLSSLGSRLDAGAVTTLANRYCADVTAICTAHGGIVDGLSGGRVSVLFGGGPTDNAESAAIGAMTAAIEIRKKARELGVDARRRGVHEDVGRGIGIASGACDVGVFGSEEQKAFTALGPPVLRAAGLHGAAPFGDIFCDEPSRLLLASHARFAALGDARYSLSALVEEHESARPPALGVVADPAPLATNAPRIFRREGEFWTLVHEGRIVRLKDSKGALYLAYLLAHPQMQIHVLELTRGIPEETRTMTSREVSELGLSTVTGPRPELVLDQRAKAAYRERLEALDEELREAELLGDGDRKDRVVTERAMLGDELAAAVGLGGRDRRTSASTERQRINVTRTVKSVIRKISDVNQELGRHLGASVRTGTFCSYAPHPGVPDDWSVAW